MAMEMVGFIPQLMEIQLNFSNRHLFCCLDTPNIQSFFTHSTPVTSPQCQVSPESTSQITKITSPQWPINQILANGVYQVYPVLIIESSQTDEYGASLIPVSV